MSINALEPTARLYAEDDHYEGESLVITSDAPNLKRLPGPCGDDGDDWDDCVSSIRVSRL
jgi:hypothetical protein